MNGNRKSGMEADMEERSELTAERLERELQAAEEKLEAAERLIEAVERELRPWEEEHETGGNRREDNEDGEKT